MHPKAKRPVRAKAFIINASALTGRVIYNVRLPRALPWARSFCPIRGVPLEEPEVKHGCRLWQRKALVLVSPLLVVPTERSKHSFLWILASRSVGHSVDSKSLSP